MGDGSGMKESQRYHPRWDTSLRKTAEDTKRLDMQATGKAALKKDRKSRSQDIHHWRIIMDNMKRASELINKNKEIKK